MISTYYVTVHIIIVYYYYYSRTSSTRNFKTKYKLCFGLSHSVDIVRAGNNVLVKLTISNLSLNSTLKIEAACPSETSLPSYQTTRCYNLVNHSTNFHHCKS